MSIAGKVLSVLVALLVGAAIYLLSMVAQLNRNHGKAIVAAEQRIVEQQKQLRETELQAFEVDQQVVAERAATDAMLTARRVGIEDLNDRVSLLEETRSRVEFRLDDARALSQQNEALVARRDAEIARLQQQIAATNGENDALGRSVADARDRLDALRDRFQTLLAENQELLQRVARREPAESTAPAE